VYVDKYGRAPANPSTTPSSLRDATPSSMKGKKCDFPFIDEGVASRSDDGVVDEAALPPLLSVADFNKLHFDIAIDDSPDALDLLAPRTNCHTIIFDRPWNRAYPPLPTMSRAHTWEEITGGLEGYWTGAGSLA